MEAHKKITLFLPMYNVADQVIGVMERIPESVLPALNHILLIDNGSTDGTVEKVAEYLKGRNDPRFRLFRNQENYMLGGSTIIAIREALNSGSDFLICLHSDGQAAPEELPNFIGRCSPSVDFVFGSRFLGDRGEYSFLRYWGNLFFVGLQKLVTGQKFRDIGAYIAFNLAEIGKHPYWQIPHDMAYQPLLVLYLSRKRRVRFSEFPIQWGKVERSSVNPFIYGLKHLARLVRMKFGRFPQNDLPLSHFRSQEINWKEETACTP